MEPTSERLLQVIIQPRFKHKLDRIFKEELFRLNNEEKFSSLTVRELDVLVLIVNGKNNPKIAECLYISRKTVEQHRKNIRRKLTIENECSFFWYALSFDLI